MDYAEFKQEPGNALTVKLNDKRLVRIVELELWELESGDHEIAHCYGQIEGGEYVDVTTPEDVIGPKAIEELKRLFAEAGQDTVALNVLDSSVLTVKDQLVTLQL